MHFGETLRASIHESWRPNYIDYAKLKKLLREDEAEQDDSKGRSRPDTPWTEQDESSFVDELVNTQLEKVNAFHNKTHDGLREATSSCEAKLEQIARTSDDEPEEQTHNVEDEESLKEILEKLDSVTQDINQLEKYRRVNYTGFLKAAKKHDRKRGSKYRVRPLLQVRLATMPFHSEDYSSLLYKYVQSSDILFTILIFRSRLSAMYSFARQKLKGKLERTTSTSSTRGGEEYHSFKYWVHPENILEVKTFILRRLPVLVYNPQTSRVVDGGSPDPSITSLYLDNSQFALYNNKVNNKQGASSLRLRWFGSLADNPEIILEKKTMEEEGGSREIRFPIKQKYVQPFLNGDYKMEKSVDKMSDRNGQDSEQVFDMKANVKEIQDFIKDENLQPMLRATYTRTAFQIPGDDRVRISLDTDMVMIREDALDTERPCRDPKEWHRVDVDKPGVEYPYREIRVGEIARFPFALLNIKIRAGSSKKKNNWVSDLMSSHLIKEAPKFSKFVHGVAELFEDYVNSFPLWLSDLETDIRRDPGEAFEEEQRKKEKQAEDDIAVGSLLGEQKISSFKAAVGSPIGKSFLTPEKSAQHDRDIGEEASSRRVAVEKAQLDNANDKATSGLRSFLPSFSTSKYARAKRGEAVKLPPGVQKPKFWMKDKGPLQVEPKVWLANERTFVKWQHISVLLASLSLGLYNAAGENNHVARSLAIVYTIIAAFAGAWGWYMYYLRSRMIRQRSGKDFDNVIGPLVVCIGLAIALCLNFGLKVGFPLFSRS